MPAPKKTETDPVAAEPTDDELERRSIAQALSEQAAAIAALTKGQEAQEKLNDKVLETMKSVAQNVKELGENQSALRQNQQIAAEQALAAPQTPTLEQVEAESQAQAAADAEAHLQRLRDQGWARFLSPVRNFVVPVEEESMVTAGGKTKVVHPQMARFNAGVYQTRNPAHIARLRGYIIDGMPDLYEDPSLAAAAPIAPPVVQDGVRGTRQNPQTASGPALAATI